MINKKTIITLLVLATSITAQAQTPNSSRLVNSVSPSEVQGVGGCVISNIQGGLASGFLGFVEGVGTHAILIDPTGSGAAGDPGCGGDFNGMLFDINDVTFLIADETAFGQPGDGLGTVTYEVSIHPFLVPGDSTMGPAPATSTETQVFAANAAGTYSISTPFPAQESITEPFYVSWKLISFVSTNGGVNRVSTLWDGVARPLGRQFLDNDGMGFVEHTVFFGAGGENGWVDVIVDGDFRPAVTDTDLSITKVSDALGNVDINDTVNYTVTVNNIGMLAATNVVVTDTLPASLTYTSSTCSDGTTSTVTGQTVTFNLSDIAAAASTNCVITTTVTGFGQITNTASVSADNDPTTANNSSSASVNGPVRVIPSLTIYGLLIMALTLVFFARRKVK
jgi:uncharacterized repeat protein (TIGR01451 family)